MGGGTRSGFEEELKLIPCRDLRTLFVGQTVKDAHFKLFAV